MLMLYMYEVIIFSELCECMFFYLWVLFLFLRLFILLATANEWARWNQYYVFKLVFLHAIGITIIHQKGGIEHIIF